MAKPLRILEVIETVGLGGVEQLNLQVFRRIDQANNTEVVVMAFDPGPLESEYRQSPFAFEFFEERRAWSPASFWNFRQKIRAFRPHLIHTHGFKALAYTAISTLGLRIPLVFSWHGYRALDTRREMQWAVRILHRGSATL